MWHVVIFLANIHYRELEHYDWRLTWVQGLRFIAGHLIDLAPLVDVAALHRLELQIAGDPTVDKELDKLAWEKIWSEGEVSSQEEGGINKNRAYIHEYSFSSPFTTPSSSFLPFLPHPFLSFHFPIYVNTQNFNTTIPFAMRNFGMRSTFQSLPRPMLAGGVSFLPKCLYSCEGQ